MTKQQLNNYAVNKLKQLAVEIEKKQISENLTDGEIYLLRLRSEIYTTLLNESNLPEF